MREVIVAITTISGKDKAVELAKVLVEQGLAACCSMYPVTSIYKWKDEIQQDEEMMLIIKTRKELTKKLKERIIQLHPYEVPELLILDVKDGHDAYINWVFEVTSDCEE